MGCHCLLPKSWIDLEIIILRDVSQEYKEQCHDIIYMWNLQYKLIYIIEINSCIETDVVVKEEGGKGRDGMGIWD